MSNYSTTKKALLFLTFFNFKKQGQISNNIINIFTHLKPCKICTLHTYQQLVFIEQRIHYHRFYL